MPLIYSACFTGLLRIEIQTLKDYVTENGFSISDKQIKFEKEVEAALENEDDEDVRAYLIDDFIESNQKYAKDFPRFFYNSSYLIIYSFFETSFVKLCDLAQRDLIRFAPYPELPEFTGTHIIPAFEYLTNKCGVNLDKEEPVWQMLLLLKDYRNFIAHDNADLNQASDANKMKSIAVQINAEFGEVLKEDKNILLIEGDVLHYKFLDLIQRYLNTVSDKIRTKCFSVSGS